MSYLTRLAADRTRRVNQRRRRRLLVTLAAAAGALAVLQYIVLIAPDVPVLDRALPNVLAGGYGQGGPVKGSSLDDKAGARQACQAPLWRRAISTSPTRAKVTVLMGELPVYTTTIDCSTFELAVVDATQ